MYYLQLYLFTMMLFNIKIENKQLSINYKLLIQICKNNIYIFQTEFQTFKIYILFILKRVSLVYKFKILNDKIIQYFKI